MKILLVYDVEGWCWDHLSKALKRYAGPEFEVRTQAVARVLPEDYEWADAALHWHWSWGNLDQLRFARRRPRLTTVLHHDAVLYEPSDYPDDLRATATSATRSMSSCMMSLGPHAGVIACNSKLAQFAKGFHSNAACLFAPVDDQVFFPARTKRKKDKMTAGFCGQVHQDNYSKPDQKGYLMVMQHLEKKLGKTIRFQSNKANYRDCKTQSEMAIWYGLADVFVCPSLVEGTPMPVMEAMASGLPVLASPVGVIPELKSDGIRVLPFEMKTAEDCAIAIEEFAFWLRELRDDFDLRQAMGQANRKAIQEHYSAQINTNRWLSFIAGESVNEDGLSDQPEPLRNKDVSSPLYDVVGDWKALRVTDNR